MFTAQKVSPSSEENCFHYQQSCPSLWRKSQDFTRFCSYFQFRSVVTEDIAFLFWCSKDLI